MHRALVVSLLVAASGCSLLIDVESAGEQAADGSLRPPPDAGPKDAAGPDAPAPPDAAAPNPDAERPIDGSPPIDGSLPIDGSPPIDAHPPDIGALPDAGCAPGARLDLCSVCGEDGEPVVPPDDEECPLTCAPVHRLRSGRCERADVRAYTRCAAEGVCHDRAANGCERGPYEVILEATVCQQFIGCVGAVAPTPIPLVGEPCHRYGVCGLDGMCSVPAECDIAGDVTLCDVVDGGCLFQPNSPLSPVVCDELCAAGGGRCVRAYGFVPLRQCAPGPEIGCDALPMPGALCVCTR